MTNITATGQYQLLPPLRETEYAALRADIQERGLMVPVELDEDGAILDGHHRVAICTELGIDWRSGAVVRRGWTEQQKREHVRKINLLRRHLDQIQQGDQYAAIAEERGIRLGEGQGDPTGKHDTLSRLAEELGVNKRTIQRRIADKRVVDAVPEIRELYDLGLKDAPTAIAEARRAIRVERREELVQAIGAAPSMVAGVFDVLYVDPPWRYEHVETENRAIENQYPTMSLDEICRMEVPAADSAIIFMWATNPKLAEAMRVLEAWGFEYRTNMVWVKDRIGMGYYARQRHEMLLIARRGDFPVPAVDDRPDSVIQEPRGMHSEKPSIVYDIIERMYPNARRVELFARSQRLGWTAWGNQAG